MKKVLFLLACMLMICSMAGCSTNGLECVEDTYESHCIDSHTYEICTYGERAQVKCPSGTSCEDGDERADCSED